MLRGGWGAEPGVPGEPTAGLLFRPLVAVGGAAGGGGGSAQQGVGRVAGGGASGGQGGLNI